MDPIQEFVPPPGLKGPNTQTILASARFRVRGDHPMNKSAREKILETGQGVRLQGFYSPQPQKEKKGLVLLLHGWEGSAESTYIRTTGRYLFDRGYDIFRLNLRDHGDSHHLNKGLFFGTLFDEVFEAAAQAADLTESRRVFAAGFSLGGNYALRIARELSRRSIPNLCHVVAVSPVLDPMAATHRADQTVLYRYYFLKKWKASLMRNKDLYPDLYDFSDLMGYRTIMELTAALLPRCTPFVRPESYFASYTLTDDALADISVPTTIIISKDDPLIPVTDFYGLKRNGLTELIVHEHGGHNGFIENYRLNAWYEKAFDRIFKKYCNI